MHAGPNRTQAGSHWRVKAIIYSFAATIAAGGLGALLGVLGGYLSLEFRIAAATIAGLTAILIGGLELSGRSVSVLQLNRETPQQWVHSGPVKWAIRNGASLGLGFTSRLGFWFWYVVPLTALLIGQPLWGVVLYGLYGAVRGWAVWLFLRPPFGMSADELDDWVTGHFPTAYLVGAGQLLAVGIVVLLVVGF